VVTKLLRKEMHYDGPVITDDLEMTAVAEHFSLQDTAVDAVLAGNDLLVFGNSKSVDPDIDAKVTRILMAEAGKDAKLREMIGRAAGRVAALKKNLGEGVDGISTRSISNTARYLTPDLVHAQARPDVLVPSF